MRYAAKPANGRSILHEQPVEPLGLGAAAVRRCQSRALALAVKTLAQFLAQFLGRLAFQRQPDQTAQARAARFSPAEVFGVRHVRRFHVAHPVDELRHQRQADRHAHDLAVAGALNHERDHATHGAGA
jgi:hypothetical protein